VLPDFARYREHMLEVRSLGRLYHSLATDRRAWLQRIHAQLFHHGVPVGGERVIVIAGPCAIESEAQAVETGLSVLEAGATLFRGGAFKPRTSPYSFQGLGEAGLKILAEVRRQTGLPIVTEVMDARDLDVLLDVAVLVGITTAPE